MSFLFLILSILLKSEELALIDFHNTYVTTDNISFSIEKDKNVYYIPAELRGEELFQYLHNITTIKSSYTYSQAKSLMFFEIDNTTCPSGKNGVWGFYSNVCVEGKSNSGEYYKEYYDLNGDGYIDTKGMNVEHIWPQSAFNENLPMKSDLHHLRPTFITPNNKRGNLPFCYVVTPTYYVASSGARGDGKCFEPPDNVKGDVARAIFYFVVRYYDRNIRNSINYFLFYQSKVSMFLHWNKVDPPDEYEKRRNDLIYKYQGNRNPFIDDPSLLDRIGDIVLASH